MFQIFVLFGMTLATLECEGKPYNLTILSLIGLTGNPPKDGRMCQAAQQFVIEAVNARRDLLPDYHIAVEYADEGPGSMFVNRAAVGFTRRMESSKTSFQSPIMLGPAFTPGCRSLGSYVQHLDSVLIATACLAPLYTNNRQTFPNLYRTRISAEINNFALVKFMKHVGHWQKVAIYANAENQYNIQLATHFHQVAKKAGISVVWFDVVAGITLATVQSMKQSKARIFVIHAVDFQSYLALLCLAFHEGLKGPKFQFIVSFSLTFDPETLPPTVNTCTKEDVMEQIQRCIFFGTTNLALENNGLSSALSLNLTSFETKFDSFLNGTFSPDFDDRHSCYDRMLQAILALQATENRLKPQNMTLRSFREFPDQVMKAANESVASSDFNGLRAGRLRYSSRLENDEEPMFAATWTKGSGLELNFKIFISASNVTTLEDPETFQILKVREFPDLSQNDYLESVFIVDALSQTGFLALISITAILLVFKAVSFLVLIFSFRQSVALVTQINRSSVFVACLILDGSAFAYTAHLHEGGTQLCGWRYMLTALGLSLLIGILSSRLVLLTFNLRALRMIRLQELQQWRKRADYAMVEIKVNSRQLDCDPELAHRDSSNNLSSKRSETTSASQPMRRSNYLILSTRQEGYAITFAVCFALLNVMAMTAILGSSDAPVRAKEPSEKEPTYDEFRDVMVFRLVDVCRSRLQTSFELALALTHLFVASAGCFAAFELRHSRPSQGDKMYRIALVNCVTLFIAVTCIMFMLADPIQQHVTMATGAFFISTSSFVVLYGRSVWRRVARTMRR